MKRIILLSLFITVFFSSLYSEEVSEIYYYVGVNRPAYGEPPSNIQIFSPFGGDVNFRFVDYIGIEHLVTRNFDAQKSQKIVVSDLVPDLPEEVYFLEVTGDLMGINIDGDQNAGAGYSAPSVMCRGQVLTKESSSPVDDTFRIYCEEDATIYVMDEDLAIRDTWYIEGGIPIVYPAPYGSNTSYFLKGTVPFVASWHDEPSGTLPLQCYHLDP